MASPFTVFRKNQKVMTVVLIGLSMFAFVILGTIQAGQGGSEANLPAVFGLLVGGLLFWWVGKGTKHVWTLTVIGCLLGIIIGSYYRGIAPVNAAFKSKAGNLSAEDLVDMRKQRELANGFAIEAFISASGFRLPPQTVAQFLPRLTGEQLFGFGSPDQKEDVALGFLLRTEARKMGMVVSDDQVQGYINRVSQNKLSKEDYLDILKRFRVTHDQMYAILKSELLSRQALVTLIPENSVTPGKLWDLYRKVNLTQQMDVISIPVEPFVAMVQDPTDEDLKTLFDAHKEDLPNEQGAGVPGFYQPEKVKIAYLEADYETIEKSVKQPTDEDIKAYYEANKANYVVNPFPKDSNEEAPEDKSTTDESEKKDDSAKPDMKKEDVKKEEPKKDEGKKAEKPETKKPETKKVDPSKKEATLKKEDKKETPEVDSKKTETPKAETPKTEKKPESTDKKPEPKKEETPKKESEEKSDDKKTSSLINPLKSNLVNAPVKAMNSLFQVALLDDEPEAKKADSKPEAPEKKAEEAKKEAPKKEADKPAKKDVRKEEPKKADAKPAKKEKKAEPKVKDAEPKKSDKKEETKADEKKPSAEMKKETEEEEKPAKPQFRTLDEDLKSEISDTILQERTFAELNSRIDEALGFMLSLGVDQARVEDDPAKLTAEQVNAKLKAYAEESKLRYVETVWLSREEFVASQEYRFKDWISVNSKGDTENQNSVTAESQHFDTGVDRLFSPLYSQDSLIGNRFAHWKIDYQEEHIPTFDEKGIKEDVTAAWKQIEARKLAQKRAEDLTAKIKEAPKEKELKEILEGETETGKEKSNTVLINGTPPTSWFTISRSSVPTNPNSPPPPPQIKLSSLGMLDSGVSEEMMETAFNKLSVGEVGTAMDFPKENVVVIKVVSRQDEAEVQKTFKDAGKSILSDPVFGQLVTQQRRSSQFKWLEDFKEDLQFTMVEQPEEDE